MEKLIVFLHPVELPRLYESVKCADPSVVLSRARRQEIAGDNICVIYQFPSQLEFLRCCNREIQIFVTVQAMVEMDFDEFLSIFTVRMRSGLHIITPEYKYLCINAFGDFDNYLEIEEDERNV